jgi:Tol biopolymer transport system component
MTRNIHIGTLAAATGVLLAVGMLIMVALVDPVGAAFPGTNGKIAFMSDRDGNEEVYVMNPDGSGPVNLTNNPAIDLQPTFSPAGKKIVFQTDRDGNSEIYTMNSNGSNPTRLTNNPADDFQPAWSPDGKKIAFVSQRDGNSEIYMMNSDGTTVTRLTNNPAIDLKPACPPMAKSLHSQATGTVVISPASRSM